MDLLKKGLTKTFMLAAGVAIGLATGIVADITLLDYVHYPNEALELIKSVGKSLVDAPFHTLGIAGDGGFLNWLFFDFEPVANLLPAFAPVSTAVTTSGIGAGVAAGAVADTVVEEGAKAALESASGLIDPMSEILEMNGVMP